jgi:serine/threonine protein kinase
LVDYTGGFSYVYLVKELADTSQGQSLNNTTHGAAERSGSAGSGRSGSMGNSTSKHSSRQGSMGRTEPEKREMVLKVTSILSRQQRDIAEKEAKLLSRLSHPSIIKMIDTCYRSVAHGGGGAFRKNSNDDKGAKERPQHLILMEFCEGGHALDVCTQMMEAGERFELSTLIIAFGQICNAVSYLHAQKPPIVHRDLKPANFLVKNGAYKLCDFGSAVFGHVDLKTPKARSEAEEVIQKTTTQMFRSPEMVDLFMAKKLTQATDVWALGCCLYSLAFLQNCFEEGSNLAILSRKYKIPDDNPYGEGLVELIDRMLTVDSKARADMTEVILCLSSLYSGRPLPPRKERAKKSEKKEKPESTEKPKKKKNEKAGTFRTDTQGVYDENGLVLDPNEAKKPAQAKKLNPDSAAARRMRTAAAQNTSINGFESFQKDDNPFASFSDIAGASGATAGVDIFGSFEGEEVEASHDVMNAFGASQNWGDSGIMIDNFASFQTNSGGTEIVTGNSTEGGHGSDARQRNRSNSKGRTGRSLRAFRKTREAADDHIDETCPDDEDNDASADDDGDDSDDDDDDEEFNVEDDMGNLNLEDGGEDANKASETSNAVRVKQGRLRTRRRSQSFQYGSAKKSCSRAARERYASKPLPRS